MLRPRLECRSRCETVQISICKDKQRVRGFPRNKPQQWWHENGATAGKEKAVLELQEI
jgi:hypothetical protein